LRGQIGISYFRNAAECLQLDVRIAQPWGRSPFLTYVAVALADKLTRRAYQCIDPFVSLPEAFFGLDLPLGLR
jgi:hypothetical protein